MVEGEEGKAFAAEEDVVLLEGAADEICGEDCGGGL